jgi:signal transduction histidine kinase
MRGVSPSADIDVHKRREGEPSRQATLDAFNCPVALLDETGRILEASVSWRSLLSRDRGVVGAVGENYLDICERRSAAISGASVLRNGVARTLGGGHPSFERTCRQLRDLERHDYRIRIKRLRHCDPHRYLVSHEEVTELTEAQEVACQASERVCDIQADERQRLAEDLHDSVGQSLVSVGLGLARLRMMTPQTDSVTALMGDLSRELQEVHAQIRTLSYLLDPPWPDEAGGLELAIREFVNGFARRAGLRAVVRLDGPSCEMDRPRALVLFRILQEGLVNIHRHAYANVVIVEFRNRQSEVTLEVRDDGCGFSTDDAVVVSPGVGLHSMRARVQRFGGVLRIDTGTTGTTLMVRMPAGKSPATKLHLEI